MKSHFHSASTRSLQLYPATFPTPEKLICQPHGGNSTRGVQQILSALCIIGKTECCLLPFSYQCAHTAENQPGFPAYRLCLKGLGCKNVNCKPST